MDRVLDRFQREVREEDQQAYIQWHRLACVRGQEIVRQRKEIEQLRQRIKELEGNLGSRTGAPSR